MRRRNFLIFIALSIVLYLISNEFFFKDQSIDSILHNLIKAVTSIETLKFLSSSEEKPLTDCKQNQFCEARAHQTWLKFPKRREFGTENDLETQKFLAYELKELANLLFTHNSNIKSKVDDRLSLQISKIEYSGHTSFQSTPETKTFASFSNVTNFFAVLSSDSLKKQQKSDPMSTIKNSVLFSCHYDSYYLGPGAFDDGISCALQIELLRTLINNFTLFPDNQKFLEHEIVFGFFGAEEQGSLGSFAFSRDEMELQQNLFKAVPQNPKNNRNVHIWNHDQQNFEHHPDSQMDDLVHKIGVFLNSEFCGSEGPEFLLRATDSWISRQIFTAFSKANGIRASPISQDIFESEKALFPSDTDFTQFDGRYWEINNKTGTDLEEIVIRKISDEFYNRYSKLRHRKSSFFQKLGKFYRSRVKKSPRKNIISGADIAGIGNGQIYHSRMDDFQSNSDSEAMRVLKRWGGNYLELALNLGSLERNFPANFVTRSLIHELESKNKTASDEKETAKQEKPFFSESMMVFLSKLGFNSSVLAFSRKIRSDFLGFTGFLLKLVSANQYGDISQYSEVPSFFTFLGSPLFSFTFPLSSVLKFNHIFSSFSLLVLLPLSLSNWFFQYFKMHKIPKLSKKRISLAIDACISGFVNFFVILSFFLGGIFGVVIESVITTRVLNKMFGYYSIPPQIFAIFVGISAISSGFFTVSIIVEWILPLIFKDTSNVVNKMLSTRALLVIQFSALHLLSISISFLSLTSSILMSALTIWHTIFYVSVYDFSFSYANTSKRIVSSFHVLLEFFVPAILIFEQCNFVVTVFQPIFGRIDFSSQNSLEKLELPDLVFRILIALLWLFTFSFLIPGFYDIVKTTKNLKKQHEQDASGSDTKNVVEVSWSKKQILGIFTILLAIYSIFVLKSSNYSRNAPKRIIVQNVIKIDSLDRIQQNYVSVAGMDPLGLKYKELQDLNQKLKFSNSTTFYSVASSAVPSVLAENGKFGTNSINFEFLSENEENFIKSLKGNFEIESNRLNHLKIKGTGHRNALQIQILIETDNSRIEEFKVFGTQQTENLQNPVILGKNRHIYSHFLFSHDKNLGFEVSVNPSKGLKVQIVSIFANEKLYSQSFVDILSSSFLKKDWIDVSDSLAFVQEYKF